MPNRGRPDPLLKKKCICGSALPERQNKSDWRTQIDVSAGMVSLRTVSLFTIGEDLNLLQFLQLDVVPRVQLHALTVSVVHSWIMEAFSLNISARYAIRPRHRRNLVRQISDLK